MLRNPVGTVAKRLTAMLRDVDFIPAQNKYLHRLQVIAGMENMVRVERKAVSEFYWLKAPPVPSVVRGISFERCPRQVIVPGLAVKLFVNVSLNFFTPTVPVQFLLPALGIGIMSACRNVSEKKNISYIHKL